MSKWSKQGDFSRRFNSGADLCQQTSYTPPSDDSKIKNISLYGYHGGTKCLNISVKSDSYGQFKTLLQREGFKKPSFLNKSCGNYSLQSDKFTGKPNQEQELFWKLLRVANELSPIDKTVVEDISSSLGIELPKSKQVPSLFDLCVKKITSDQKLFVNSMSDEVPEIIRQQIATTFAEKALDRKSNGLLSL